jgi:hypothetical protein
MSQLSFGYRCAVLGLVGFNSTCDSAFAQSGQRPDLCSASPESCGIMPLPRGPLTLLDACYKRFNVTRHLPTPTPEPTVMPVSAEVTYEGVLKQLIDVMVRLRALLMTQIYACGRKSLPLSAPANQSLSGLLLFCTGWRASPGWRVRG